MHSQLHYRICWYDGIGCNTNPYNTLPCNTLPSITLPPPPTLSIATTPSGGRPDSIMLVLPLKLSSRRSCGGHDRSICSAHTCTHYNTHPSTLSLHHHCAACVTVDPS